ncbi:unnamed protein product [Soboliphyme baturini]|uniref:Chromosome partitioning protein ParA n=1 Tax=Soboliphyme baturini TaxID=241478 RepID=A0A183J5M7_9BILA|nr:unnamed protein product [Soboliphyme baturini]
MKKLNYDENRAQQLKSEKQVLLKEIYSLTSELEDFARRVPVEFTYTDPEFRFDHSRVKGVVANLFQLIDPKFATAIETVAGSSVS